MREGDGGGAPQANPPQENRPDGRAEASDLFDEADVAAVVGAVAKYAAFARSTLEADELAVGEGRPAQVFGSVAIIGGVWCVSAHECRGGCGRAFARLTE